VDHVQLTFFQFFWAFTCVGPCSYLLWKKATILFKLRLFLVKVGFSTKTLGGMDVLLAKIVLEQSHVIHYIDKAMKVVNSEMCNVADFFFFPDFSYVDIEGKFQIANFRSVEIDLDTKRMVGSKIDKANVTKSQALILLWHSTTSYLRNT
jgi:hypothetical protein